MALSSNFFVSRSSIGDLPSLVDRVQEARLQLHLAGCNLPKQDRNRERGISSLINTT